MFLLPIALALFPSLASEPVGEEDHTGLIPTGATVLVRLESLDAAHAAFVRMNALLDLESEIPAKEELLRDMFSLPIDTDHVDPTRPIYMAADVTLGQPLPTFLLPARDVAGLSSAVAAIDRTAVVRGDWLGFSMGPRYQPVASNPRVTAMQPGVVSMNVDLEQLLEIFGGFIEMGLTQIESSMADMPPPEESGGIDAEAMMELYLDGVRTFMDCAESLDLAIHEDGQELALNATYTALEGSELAGLLKPRPLPETLPVPLDDGAQIAFLVSSDWKELMTCSEPVIESLVDAFPDETSAGLRAYVAALTEAYALMGDTAVGSGAFGPQGMHFAFHAEAADSAAFVEKVAEALTGSAAPLGQMGVVFDAPRTIEVGGVTARQWEMQVDYEKLGSLSTPGLSPGESEELREMMSRLYGEHPRFTLAQAGGRICMSMGSDEADLARALAVLGAERVSAKPVLAGLHGLPQSINPLVMYRADLGRLLSSMGPLMPSGSELPDLSDAPLQVTVWMGLEGRRWMGGMSARSAELKNFVQALKDD